MLFKRNNKKKILRPQIKRTKPVRSKQARTDTSFRERFFGKPHWNLIVIITLLLIGGLLMNYSASAILSFNRFEDSFYYFKRQIIWVVLGIGVALICYVVPLKYLRKYSVVVLITGIILLLYMLPEALFGKTEADGSTSGLQMPFVVTRNGATRWMNFEILEFQPSELVKIGFILYLSAWLSRKLVKPKEVSALTFHLKSTFIPFLLLLGFVSSLVLLQRDFDSTIVLVLTVMVVYYISDSDRIHTLGSGIILAFAGIFGSIAAVIEPYRRARISSWITLFTTGRPADAAGDDFQVWNGLIGLGSGFLFGRGYNESRIKQGFLQEAAYTDSIIVVIGEEFGLFGIIMIVLAFLYFGSIGLGIASKCKDKFTALLAIGLTSWIVIQAFLNIGGSLAIIPFGGMALPFFTYGGSGILMASISIGLLLNIHKENSR